MKTELIVRSKDSEVDFALLKDGRLIELHKETTASNFNVGDVFYANVKKTVQGLNAAFVGVGYEKDAFLHYHDLGPDIKSFLKFIKQVSTGNIKEYNLKNFKFEPKIEKSGTVDEVLKSNQKILVQIAKEPISTKGPRLTSELSLAGRYMVLVPFSDRVSVSQKIKSKAEKSRLKRLALSIKPKGFGVILRTVAQERKVAELDADMQQLLDKWTTMLQKLRKVTTPSKVLSEMNRGSSILRDIFNDSFSAIVVDDETLYYELKDYVMQIAPEKESIVKLYKNSVYPIFEKYGIERQIKSAFGRTVSMSKGAYLVIEHTEAMHVIDVNSGNRSNKATTQAKTAMEVNLISATEIARQIRLRDMGGIIVVDFIDLHNASDRRKLYEHMRDEMSDDRAKHKILPPSKFGLIQITRQRVRPVMDIKTREKKPALVDENGDVEAPILLISKIEKELNKLLSKNKKIVLHVHPFIAAFLTKGLFSIRFRWYRDYKKWIKIIPSDALNYLDYKFLNHEGKEL